MNVTSAQLRSMKDGPAKRGGLASAARGNPSLSVGWATGQRVAPAKRKKRGTGKVAQAKRAWCEQRAKVSQLPDGTVNLTLPVPPSVNAVWLRSRRGGVYKNPKAVSFSVLVQTTCVLGRVKILEGDVEVSVVIVNKPNIDADNVMKCALDSMQGNVYANDKQVRKQSSEHAREGTGVPMLWVMVTPMKGGNSDD